MPKPNKLVISRKDCGAGELLNHCPLYHFGKACGWPEPSLDNNGSFDLFYKNEFLPEDTARDIWQAWDSNLRPKAEILVTELFATIGVTVEFHD